LQLDWLMVRLRPNAVSSGSIEMQFDCTEQSPQPSQTRGLISTRRAGAAPFFGRAGLLEDNRGDASYLPHATLNRVQLVAMVDRHTGRELGAPFPAQWRVGHQGNGRDAFRVQLPGDACRIVDAFRWLAARHCNRIVEQDLVGDVGAYRDGRADRQQPRMLVGSISQVLENVRGR